MEEILLLVTTDSGNDLIKGKGNRDGLIQQIVTYVRDGHTVTRKQWVRSEFADHAKKNEEEKKKTLLEEKEREDRKRQKTIAENNTKKKNEDKRARKHQKAQEAELTHQGHAKVHKVSDKQLEEYKKKLREKAKEAKKEEKERKEKKNKDKGKEDKSKHSRFGQAEQTRADNKAEEKRMQGLT